MGVAVFAVKHPLLPIYLMWLMQKCLFTLWFVMFTDFCPYSLAYHLMFWQTLWQLNAGIFSKIRDFFDFVGGGSGIMSVTRCNILSVVVSFRHVDTHFVTDFIFMWPHTFTWVGLPSSKSECVSVCVCRGFAFWAAEYEVLQVSSDNQKQS